MGYIRHHAIIVTSWDDEKLFMAHAKAKEIFGELVSEKIEGQINGFTSSFVAPDGSKEGWQHSDEGDENRKKFIAFLDDETFGSVRFVELYYGDDNMESKIMNHN